MILECQDMNSKPFCNDQVQVSEVDICWIVEFPKGQLISKANCQAVNSSKKQTNELFFIYYAPCFCLFLGRNWRHQKDISKLTDL